MDVKKVQQLLELINDLVNSDEPWEAKKSLVLANASADDIISLEEFAAWFTTDESEKEDV